jgi:hypothetical protein
MNKLLWLSATIAILTLLGVGVACEDDPSEEEARAALCGDLQQLETTINTFLELNAQSTIGEIRAARDDVGDAVDDVQTSAEDVDDAETAELEQAYDDFNETVDGISDDQTAQEAVDAVRASAEAVAAAEQQLFTDLACEGATPTEPPAEQPTEVPAATEPPVEAPTDTVVPADTAVPTEPAAPTEPPPPTEPAAPTATLPA